MPKLLVAGTGQLSVLQIIARQTAYEFIGFLDDNKANAKTRELFGHKIVGGFDYLSQLDASDVFVVNSIARSAAIRASSTIRLQSYNARFANLCCDSLDLSMVKTGIGNIIGTDVIIEPNVKIGNHNIILSGTTIAHDTTIGNNNFIGLSSIIQGNVSIGDNTFLSAGTIVEPDDVIHDKSVTMAGAVVFQNVSAASVVIVKPPREIMISKSSRHYFDKL